MKALFLILGLLCASPVLAHPGHGAPDHAWFEHAALIAALVAIGAVLLWGVHRRHAGRLRGVLPLAIAVALALGAGSAGVTLPL